MRQLSDYEVYIFDCDGVILNSNELKIEAMEKTLKVHFSDPDMIEKCLDYFRNNFGKSRFHHVAHFLENIFIIATENKNRIERLILEDFSKQCRTLYMSAELTPDFTSFVEQCEGKRYVASGSEQGELRDVFGQRKLDAFFDGIFGSPTPKAEIIQGILEQEKNTNAVMFGDAESDMLSAQQNHIDFVFYAPFSNVKEKMVEKCKVYQFLIINDFSTVEF